MARSVLRGTATVVSAVEDAPRYGPDHGESGFIDLIVDRFDSTVWDLELDVQPDGGTPYRVSGRFKMPNRVHKITRTLSGPPRLAPGVVLPVTIDQANPQRVEILWKDLIRSGGTAQLYDEQPGASSITQDIRDLFRASPAAPAALQQPSSPRPTPETHPPIEGVDFETYIAAVTPVARGQVDAAHLEAHYEAHGFPRGRAGDIAQAWAERAVSDPGFSAWYFYLTQQERQ